MYEDYSLTFHEVCWVVRTSWSVFTKSLLGSILCFTNCVSPNEGLKAKHPVRPTVSPSKVDVRFPSSTMMTTTTLPTTSENEVCGVNVGCFSSSEGNSVKYSETSDGLAVAFDITCALETDGWCSVGFSNTGSMVRHVLKEFFPVIIFSTWVMKYKFTSLNLKIRVWVLMNGAFR